MGIGPVPQRVNAQRGGEEEIDIWEGMSAERGVGGGGVTGVGEEESGATWKPQTTSRSTNAPAGPPERPTGERPVDRCSVR